ncbi:alpha/beta fold hydrolase [Mesorhizobium sp. AR10]|uniref:alpha/beta fold hydrolase n=1 Tax=Mesorhizobium sp. AR10 TaxID=2865839 RepID=UPI00215E81A7|nr:alpha/beta hydrolase [Mesorhizobium sp. AR10]UVK40117.1 alpha/beta fold hydrolase [Mesorhizobium sp. AR10]
MNKTVEAEIVSQAFGDPAHPAMLLIMGAMASMLWWPEALCRKLAGTGLFVIRYDNRDTGLSTKYAPGEPPYSFDDMADDAIRVLDNHDIRKAHVVGMSMGGMIAQLVALKHPSRVASLTVISSSPVGTDTSHLPGTTAAYMEHSAEGADVDWSDRGQVIDFIVKDAHAIASTMHPFDETGTRAFVEQDYDRSGGFLSATNHFMVKGGEDWKGRLHEMKAPLLVIHGTSDPIFPVEHGAALVDAVADARLVRIEGGGHELHPDDWTTIVAAIVAHTLAT